MAIAKNSTAAAPKTAEKPSSKTPKAGGVITPDPKLVTKAPHKTAPTDGVQLSAPDQGLVKPAASPKPAASEAVSDRISRKEIAAGIRAKVMATGMAISPKVAEVVSVAYEEVLQEALVAGKSVSLLGFGVFSVVDRVAITRPNPQKPGEKIYCPAYKAVRFKVGTALKKAVNGGDDPPEEEEVGPVESDSSPENIPLVV